MTRPRRRRTQRRVAALAIVTLGLSDTTSARSSSVAQDVDASRGGTALIAMTQEPGLMNPLFNVEGATDLAFGTVIEPLMVPRADGHVALARRHHLV